MIEFIVGVTVGVVVAGMVGRVKFLKVQNAFRQFKELAKAEIDNLYGNLVIERNLTTGLTQELDAVATRSRIKTTA